MFSTALAKILPLASLARHVVGLPGSTKITGPLMSVTASALTQAVSSSGCSEVAPVTRSVEEDCSVVEGSVVRLRFLGLASPLKESAFTILGKRMLVSSMEAEVGGGDWGLGMLALVGRHRRLCSHCKAHQKSVLDIEPTTNRLSQSCSTKQYIYRWL